MPDTIIVSNSRPTRETASLITNNISLPNDEILLKRSLYLTSYKKICDIAGRYAEDNLRLLMLAHNPGMDDITYYLCDKRPELTANGKLMTTCSIAYFEMNSIDDFKRPGQGKLLDIIRPKSIR